MFGIKKVIKELKEIKEVNKEIMRTAKLIALIADNPSFELDLDNIGTDFTFTRASSATYVDVNGVIKQTASNLITQSEDFLPANPWYESKASSVANSTTAPNGETTATKLLDDSSTGTGEVSLRYGLSLATTTTHTVSMFAKKDQIDWLRIRTTSLSPLVLDSYYDLTNGALGTSSADTLNPFIEDYGNGWYRCGYSFTTQADGAGTIYVYAAEGDNDSVVDLDGTSSVFLWGAQLEAYTEATDYVYTTGSAKYDIPRIDYSDGEPAFLLEPASTNLLTYSEDFSDASWLVFGTGASKVGSSTETAPDGSTNAYEVSVGTVGGSFNNASALYQGFTNTASQIYTFSCYIRTVSGSDTVRVGMLLTSSNYPNTGDISINETWQRIEITGTATTTGTGNVAIRTNVAGTTGNILVWGAQLEALSYPTSYIPTLGATVTRATELCVDGGSASVINSEEGTLIVEIASLVQVISSGRYISISDGTLNNRLIIYFLDTGQINCILRVGGATQAFYSDTGNTTTDYHKIAFQYKEDDFALWIDGVEVYADSSGSVFSADTLNKINFADGNSITNYFYGKVKSIQLYKEALSDSDLESKTT